MQVNHHCDNPPCVNVEHLYEGTQIDNMRDKLARDRDFNRRKTHCPRGHAFSGANLHVRLNGQRTCRECERVNVRRYRERQRLQKVS
jgi:hypothetical protein